MFPNHASRLFQGREALQRKQLGESLEMIKEIDRIYEEKENTCKK